MNNFIVITTINEKSEAIIRYESFNDYSIVLIGDKKSKTIDSCASLRFIGLDEQMDLGYEYAKHCPLNHYARKNIGYLYAISNDAEIIFDTDDDNYPLDNWSAPEFFSGNKVDESGLYLNIYKYFTDKKVWPRGLPLACVNSANANKTVNTSEVEIGVWQGLANGDPDVDAIYRLVDNEEVIFDNNSSMYLPSGQYCPFNSQNTFWNSKFFILMYLPATTSFRFTDILRGYVAQRLLWEEGCFLGFTEATVHQDRNEHDYMKDFSDEVEMYLQVEKVTELLNTIELKGSLADKLRQVYRSLCDNGIIADQELNLLDLWLDDYRRSV